MSKPVILGQQDALDAFDPFCSPELHELFHGANGMLLQAKGTPLEVPLAIPIGSHARIVLTLKRYHALAKRLVAESQKAGVEDGPAPDYDAVVAEAKALLTVGPPLAKPKVSRLVVPR